jgi:hypothetical protein
MATPDQQIPGQARTAMATRHRPTDRRQTRNESESPYYSETHPLCPRSRSAMRSQSTDSSGHERVHHAPNGDHALMSRAGRGAISRCPSRGRERLQLACSRSYSQGRTDDYTCLSERSGQPERIPREKGENNLTMLKVPLFIRRMQGNHAIADRKI